MSALLILISKGSFFFLNVSLKSILQFVHGHHLFQKVLVIYFCEIFTDSKNCFRQVAFFLFDYRFPSHVSLSSDV